MRVIECIEKRRSTRAYSERAVEKEKLEQIADEIRETAFAYEGETLSVSLTFGLTDVTGAQSLDEIVKEADDLLYRGKAEGRNRIVTSGDRKE